jgi:hypothetical protein
MFAHEDFSSKPSTLSPEDRRERFLDTRTEEIIADPSWTSTLVSDIEYDRELSREFNAALVLMLHEGGQCWDGQSRLRALFEIVARKIAIKEWEH